MPSGVPLATRVADLGAGTQQPCEHTFATFAFAFCDVDLSSLACSGGVWAGLGVEV